MDVRKFLTELRSDLNFTKDEEIAMWLGTTKSALDKWVSRNTLPKKWEVIINKKKKENKLSGQNRNQQQDKSILSVCLLQAGAGEGVYNFEEQNTLLSLNSTLFPNFTEKKLTAVEIMGDSMEPILLQGDYIVITPTIKERQTEDGVFAIRIDGMVKVKSLQFKLDGTINIISFNKNYETEVYNPKKSQIDFQILGRQMMHLTFK